MFCGQCGTENSNNEIYCKNCGRLIQDNYMQMQNNQGQQQYDNIQGQNVYYQNDEKYKQALRNKNLQFAKLSIIIPIIAIVMMLIGRLELLWWLIIISVNIGFYLRGNLADKKLSKIGLILTSVLVVAGLLSFMPYYIRLVTPHAEKVKNIEIVEQFEMGSSVEEANEIIGFEGELVKEEDNFRRYLWQLTDESSLVIQYEDGEAYSIEYTPDVSELRDSRLNFPKHEKLKERMKEHKNYDEILTELKNIEGVMTSKSSLRNERGYIWVDRDGDVLEGAFFGKNKWFLTLNDKFC